ncbi:hypothetical protein NPIL_20271 [Nephila pilipes]|uniref:Uncharacterized protein n=1 Tax=Nephila pilipes TaxID=299642 RepID=A0A8X6NNF6_NEPPI|nr:hypothetical protein NPIL_20271 [Nephila pilipes]
MVLRERQMQEIASMARTTGQAKRRSAKYQQILQLTVLEMQWACDGRYGGGSGSFLLCAPKRSSLFAWCFAKIPLRLQRLEQIKDGGNVHCFESIFGISAAAVQAAYAGGAAACCATYVFCMAAASYLPVCLKQRRRLRGKIASKVRRSAYSLLLKIESATKAFNHYHISHPKLIPFQDVTPQ